MKIAISGKGGVGKSTISAALSLMLARDGHNVLALDADPDANLAAALGFSKDEQQQIVSLSRQVDLIEERTGAKVKHYGQIFKLNPEVSDIADRYAVKREGVSLLVLGAVERGGSGCACPENVLIRALVSDLVLNKKETLIMDMEAGIEHLGRATSRGVDIMLIVVEPGQRSIDCADRIIKMSAEIGITNVKLIANKVNDAKDEAFIRAAFPDYELISIIPYSEDIRTADRQGCSILNRMNADLQFQFESILNHLYSNELKCSEL